MPAKKANEITIIRVYDAPVAAVWDAWTDEKQVAKWWGPRGFTITTHSKDLRVGGHWNYTMHGPDGTNYVNKTKYFEVEKHKKLVYDHGGNDEQAPLFRVTVLFSEKAGKTTMDMTMALPTQEAANETRKFIHKAGGNATWDRLAEYLDKEIAGKETFVIARSFDAPLETMWEMWANPKHLAAWMAPAGASMHIISGEIKEGSEVFYSMPTAAGVTMYGKVKFLTLRKPDYQESTQCFTDEHGNISRHPMAPTWPEVMLRKVQFVPEGAEQTRVVISWEPHGNVTAEELNVFIQGRSGMTQGWTGSLDKLEAYLHEPERRKLA